VSVAEASPKSSPKERTWKKLIRTLSFGEGRVRLLEIASYLAMTA